MIIFLKSTQFEYQQSNDQKSHNNYLWNLVSCYFQGEAWVNERNNHLSSSALVVERYHVQFDYDPTVFGHMIDCGTDIFYLTE